MNLIPKMMDALGLKVGELFKVKIQGRETGVVFWFTGKELMYGVPGKFAVNAAGEKTLMYGHASNQTIAYILYGEYEVIKLPQVPENKENFSCVKSSSGPECPQCPQEAWVPKIGENYWCVKPSSDPDYPQTELVTLDHTVFSLFNLASGNHFQTQDDAEAKKRSFVKKLIKCI